MKRTKSTNGNLNVNEQIIGELVSRVKLASRLGQQYGGDRDVYQALGYPTSLKFTDFATRYIRQDIAKAVIDKPVQVTWRGGFEIIETDDDEDTELERVWRELDEKFSFSSAFSRLDRLTGLGQYGILVLGLDDIRQPEDFRQPVNPGNRELLYLKPLSQGSVEIQSYVEDPSDPRYGMPEIYDVTIYHPTKGTTSQLLVHYTRAIHVVDETMESDVLGTPRLQSIYNRLMDLEKLTGGSAEMFWRGARPGYTGKVDPEYNLTDANKDDLQTQLDEFENNLRRFLINEGVDVQALAQQVADPSSHVDVQIQMISAEKEIPKRILVGSERGELASGQDENAWLAKIDARRMDFAEPGIVRKFVDRLIEIGTLPEPKDKYMVKWEPLYKESEKDKADIGKTRSEALKAYAGVPIDLFPPDAFFEIMLGLEKEQIELINEQRDQAIQDEENDIVEEEGID